MATTGSLRARLWFGAGRVLTRARRPARALAARGECDAAIAAFERALALEPQDARSHFNVAYLLQRLGRHEAASARFERALALDPGIDRARKGLDASRAALEK
jgi:Flp pilus assembly protein TadD